jgi:hypothetical protein
MGLTSDMGHYTWDLGHGTYVRVRDMGHVCCVLYVLMLGANA